MKTAKFKTGDEVKIKRGLKVDHVYGEMTLQPYMMFDGYKTIDEATDYGNYYLNRFFYAEEMLVIKRKSTSK